MSLSTVSLAMNNRGYVSDEARTKILKVVEELGYHPTRSAKGLASNTSGNIGFILSDDHFSQAEPFYTRIFLGTEFEARNLNYYILLTSVGKYFAQSTSIPRFLLERNVDGVIIAGKVNEKLVAYIESHGVPVVLIDYAFKRRRLSSVLIDNRNGASTAVNHLLSLGHRQIAFVGGDMDHPSIEERYEGYCDALAGAGIAADPRLTILDEQDTGVENGCRAAVKLLASGGKPTAVFAANDALATGCIRCAKQQGLKIPQDLAVIGFDDVDMSSHLEPRLTTMRVFKEEMGKLAVQRLVHMIGSKTQSIVTTHVPVELVVRESTVLRIGD